MTKHSFQDIVPPGKRYPDRPRQSDAVRTRAPRKAKEPAPPAESSGRNAPQKNDQFSFLEKARKKTPPALQERRRGKKLGAWSHIAALVLIVALVFGGLSLFSSGARVEVYPRTAKTFVDGSFIANQAGVPGMLGFEVLRREIGTTRELAAHDVAQVEERARGSITIANAFSEEPQRLIANTRFATPEGLIFRTPESVSVPGYRKEADGTLMPGTITIAVVADETGEAYNIGPSTFTIPGFTGTSRFEAITASSEAPMTGGFAGERPVVSESTLAEARQTMQQELRETLLSMLAADAELASTHSVIPESALFDFTQGPTVTQGQETVLVEEKAVMRVVSFRKLALAEYLASETLATYDREPLYIRNLESLTMTVTPLEESLSGQLPWDEETVSVAISGEPEFVWLYDRDQFLADIAGRNSDALPTILAQHPGLDRAEVSIRPFWKNTVPEDRKDITLEEKVMIE